MENRMSRTRTLLLCCRLTVAATICGCSGSGHDAPKFPLGHSNLGSTGEGGGRIPGGIGGEAKIALDSGNLFFRAKQYDRALGQYRRSAQLAPTELAPLFGILMVTDVTKDVRLADSTRARMRQLNPAAADSSAVESHAEIVHEHSRVPKAPPVPRA